MGNNRRLFIDEYRWATSVDDILNTLAFEGPLVFGMDWFDNFDRPVKHAFGTGTRLNFFIGEGNLGSVRGGHAIICQGYYRNRAGNEWVRFQNSWGWDYPLVWMPVNTLRRIWDEDRMEAGIVTRVRA
jgi:hypothetical protein